MSAPGAHPPGTEHTVEQWMARARAWLDELQTPIGLRASSAEGHFHALFGRDTLWSVMLALEASRLRTDDADLAAWAEQMAAHGLRALAATQGTREHDAIEEQPGKIVHEFWPETPEHLKRAHWPMEAGRYYGSADGTYLFLMTAATVWRQCAGGRAIVDELWDHVVAALHWALRYGDADGDGLMEAYPRQPEHRGLTNQVWKDSFDSVLTEAGAPAVAPVAWVELQGYAIAAFRAMAGVLADRGQDEPLRQELLARAETTAGHLARFALVGEGAPAIALTADKTPVPIVSSNIGHVLWCEALAGGAAQDAASRLMHPDMLSAWGLRTISARSYAFDPFSYHRGSIWPFDNGVAAGGLWRIGRRDDAREISRRVVGALNYYGTPEELYCSLPATWVRAPDPGGADLLIDYRRSNAIQAWTAAALLLFGAQLLAEG